MRLVRFSASDVYGRLPFHISFRPDLTFLIGLNGSGKTTVLRLIMAILHSALDVLAEIPFSEASLTVSKTQSELYTIRAVTALALARPSRRGRPSGFRAGKICTPASKPYTTRVFRQLTADMQLMLVTWLFATVAAVLRFCDVRGFFAPLALRAFPLPTEETIAGAAARRRGFQPRSLREVAPQLWPRAPSA